MADFTLPANSKITSGDHYPAASSASNVRVFQIYRWSPDDDANPRVDRFEVDLDECGPMVLDALIKIKSEQDSSWPSAGPAARVSVVLFDEHRRHQHACLPEEHR